MTEVRWTSPAIDQLEAIIGRIFEDNPEAARATVQNILDRVAQLESFPRLGRPGERKETRELVTGAYVVVYRLTRGVAEILHIWHGAQDWR